jgi:erythromycin esterase
MKYCKIALLLSIVFTAMISCRVSNSNHIVEVEENDFQALENYLSGKSIVGIGEVTHGDGTFFELKTELIEYLHQELGFEAVLMESDFLSVDHSFESLDTLNSYEAARIGVLDTWAGSQEYLSLFDYLKKVKNTANPLYLHGFDSQITGDNGFEIHARQIDSIKKYINQEEKETLNKSLDIIVKLNQQGVTADSLADLINSIRQIQKNLNSVVDRKTILWLKNIESNLKTFRFRSLAPPVTPANIPEVFSHPYNIKAGSVRDSMMAENVEFYMSTYDKVIIWAANNHVMLKSKDGETDRTWMGELLKAKYGANYYSILALVNQGKWSFPNGKQKGDIPKSKSGTLSFHIDSVTNAPVSFLDLNSNAFTRMKVRETNWTVTDSIFIRDFGDAVLFMKESNESTQAYAQTIVE